MAAQHALDQLAQILDEMEPVGHLERVGRPLARPLARPHRVIPAAVACDDLAAGMRLEPTRQRLGGAVGQQVHRPVALQVDHDRAVAPPTAKGEIIHAQHARRRADGDAIGAQTRHDERGGG